MWKYFFSILVVLLLGVVVFAVLRSSNAPITGTGEVVVTPLQEDKNTDEEQKNDRDPNEPLYGGTYDKRQQSTYHVTETDCENSCEDFSENSSAGRYCRELCGIIPTKEQETDCSAKDGLSRDYCLRDRAISKKDPNLCEEISDRSLGKQCRSRVAEQIIDEL